MKRYTLTAQDRLDCADIFANPPSRFEIVPDMDSLHSMSDALRYVLALGERAQFFEWNDDREGSSFWNVPLALQIIHDGRTPTAAVPLLALLPTFPRVGIDRIAALSPATEAATPIPCLKFC